MSGIHAKNRNDGTKNQTLRLLTTWLSGRILIFSNWSSSSDESTIRLSKFALFLLPSSISSLSTSGGFGCGKQKKKKKKEAEFNLYALIIIYIQFFIYV